MTWEGTIESPSFIIWSPFSRELFHTQMTLLHFTCSSLIATQQSDGIPLSTGTRNWRHPDQCPTSPIMHTILTIRTTKDVPDSECWKINNVKLALMVQSKLKDFTCNSLIATQELAGKPCSIGIRNCKQPDQWPMSNMMLTKLKIRMKTPSELKNCYYMRQTCRTYFWPDNPIFLWRIEHIATDKFYLVFAFWVIEVVWRSMLLKSIHKHRIWCCWGCRCRVVVQSKLLVVVWECCWC